MKPNPLPSWPSRYGNSNLHVLSSPLASASEVSTSEDDVDSAAKRLKSSMFCPYDRHFVWFPTAKVLNALATVRPARMPSSTAAWRDLVVTVFSWPWSSKNRAARTKQSVSIMFTSLEVTMLMLHSGELGSTLSDQRDALYIYFICRLQWGPRPIWSTAFPPKL